MKRLKFLVGRILHMDYRQFFDTIRTVHARSGRSRIFLFFDIIYCGIKYQAGYIDYKNAAMYDLNAAQRADVITRGINNRYVARYNDPNYTHYFLRKADFNERFAAHIGRDWLLVDGEEKRDAFAHFIAGKEDFILKPVDGTHGDGVFKLPASMEAFDENLGRIPYLAEERIVQVPALAALNPTSVNTIRAVTFLKKDGEAVLLAAYLRIGNGGVVDNFCGGGMLAPVDIETGRILYPAVNEANEAFSTHPGTGVPIVGFCVPQWEAVKALALAVAPEIPQVRYVGWDIAVTEKGPCLIEGNEYPGHVFYVLYQHHPDHMGLRHVFEAVMD